MTSVPRDREVILGFDIGGTKTALRATARRTGRRIAAAQFATPCGFGPEALIALLRNEHNLASRIGSRVLRARALGEEAPLLGAIAGATARLGPSSVMAVALRSA